MPPGFSGSVLSGLSFNPENLQIETPAENWLFGLLLLPFTSPATAETDHAVKPKPSNASRFPLVILIPFPLEGLPATHARAVGYSAGGPENT